MSIESSAHVEGRLYGELPNVETTAQKKKYLIFNEEPEASSFTMRMNQKRKSSTFCTSF
ncbi:hypothetical protein Bpfe_023835, partial [Biomphalaria pfeifferi]